MQGVAHNWRTRGGKRTSTFTLEDEPTTLQEETKVVRGDLFSAIAKSVYLAIRQGLFELLDVCLRYGVINYYSLEV